MPEEPEPTNGSHGSAAFESDIRRNRELMQQMADREYWEVDPVWARVGRVAGTVALYAAAIAGAAFIVWLFVSILLGS